MFGDILGSLVSETKTDGSRRVPLHGQAPADVQSACKSRAVMDGVGGEFSLNLCLRSHPGTKQAS